MNYEHLKQQYTEFSSSGSKDLGEFDKNFFLIAAGTFTFSITFIKDIVKIQGACCIWLLFASWLLGAVSIYHIVRAYFASAAINQTISIHLKEILSNVTEEQFEDLKDATKEAVNKVIIDVINRQMKAQNALRKLGILFFSAAIVLLAAYVSINMYLENHAKRVDPPKISDHLRSFHLHPEIECPDLAPSVHCAWNGITYC